METKEVLFCHITNVLGTTKTHYSALQYYDKKTLQNIKDQLSDYGDPPEIEIKGECPRILHKASEAFTGYRKKMHDYIKSNTGIEIPVNCGVAVEFYNDVAKHLKLIG